jgi:predicted nucleotidyltransferase component of viral defense system
MDISGKKILTKLQKSILDYFFKDDFPFFLTGGTALSAFYLYHRHSYDLDLFTLKDNVILNIGSRIEQMGKALRIKIRSLQTGPMFRRFLTESKDEKVIVDFVRDIDFQVVQKKPILDTIQVDSLDDIICNKIGAILGRKEIKDFIDLYYISKKGFDLDKYLILARKKDSGINKAHLAFVIKGFKIIEKPNYMIEKLNLDEINSFYEKLAEKWAKDSFPIF